jgi:hypothetical protein
MQERRRADQKRRMEEQDHQENKWTAKKVMYTTSLQRN